MNTYSKKRILSVTKDDCEWQYFRAGGKGGQAQNKKSTGVRCIHHPSGAVGEARDSRDQLQNRRAAFRRMAETKEFKRWIRIQSGLSLTIEAEVEKQMQPHNLKIEMRDNNQWVDYKDEK